MTFLPFLHFFCFLVYIYLAGFVLFKNAKSEQNIASAAHIFSFALWSFGFIFIHSPHTQESTARLFLNISSFGWMSFSSFFLWSTLILTEKKRILKSKLIYPALFLPPAFLIYKQWTSSFIAEFIKQPYGWSYVWKNSVWVYLFCIYYMLFMAIALYFIFTFRKKTADLYKKKQSQIIFNTMLFPLFLGTANSLIFQQLGLHFIPSLGNVVVLIWAFGVVYAIVKYKFLTITVATAAENILATMADSVILLNPKGKIVRVNQAVIDLSGYQKHELHGKPLQMIFDGNGSKELLNDIIRGKEVRNYDLTSRTKEGKNIPVILSSSTLRDEAGSLAGVICIATDITERKESEEKLKEALKKLEQSNEDLKEFAYVVSHDLKAPLRGVSQLADWLAKDYSEAFDKEGKENMKLLLGRVARMENLIDGVLNYSRAGRDGGNKEHIDLNVVVREVIEDLSPPKNIKVKIFGTLPNVYAEKIQIGQVFQNLIGNAVKYMDKPKGEVKVACADESSQWKFSVSDNGPGIDEQHHQKIFQIFQALQARDISDCTGIGLSIVKKIIERQGGRTWVESIVGRGSTFFFTLPKTNPRNPRLGRSI